jgi:hypothetical protein
MSQVSARGWRAKEPINIPAERPRKVAQLSEMKFGSPVDHKSLANALSLPAQLVEEVLQVHSLRSSLEDGSSQLGSPKILNFVRNNIEGH